MIFIDFLVHGFLCTLHGMRMVSVAVQEIIEKASSLVKHLDLTHFSCCGSAAPGRQLWFVLVLFSSQ